MADVEAVVTVAKTKWQKLIPVSMEVGADLIDIWAADTGEGEHGEAVDGGTADGEGRRTADGHRL